MLLELRVKNLAIIEAIDIPFARGLNVLTGETGAGKSILLEALNLILGGRSDRSLVRTGQSEAWVEGLFEVDQSILDQLETWGVQASLEEPLVLKRIVQQSGRSRAYINCTTVPARVLQQLAPMLVDFGRQHDQAVLLNPENHLELLDTFAGATEERAATEAAYQTLAHLRKEKKRLFESRHHRSDRTEFLKFQREAIWEVDPQPGEEDQIEEELNVLSQKEKQKDLADRAEHLLDQHDNSVQTRLADALELVEEVAELDESLESLVEDLQNALVSVEEAARTLRVHKKKLHLDRQHSEALRSRLDQILKLQQRYGGDYDAVMERLDDIEEELKSLEKEARREATLDDEIEEAKEALSEVAAPLTQKRIVYATSLTERVQRELDELAMPGTRFVVHFKALGKNEGALCPWDEDAALAFAPDEISEPEDDISTAIDAIPPEASELADDDAEVYEDDESSNESFDVLADEEGDVRIGAYGAEKGSFFLAANQGEELRPLERVASGGELSRILLALKRVLADASNVQTFVFDEIDSGVAGAAATRVAKKLRQIASQQGDNAQILCISHTAQIAAEADAHIHVRKATVEGRTRSRAVQLEHEERVIEIARMLAGDQSLDQAIDLARQLLGSAENAPLPQPVEEPCALPASG